MTEGPKVPVAGVAVTAVGVAVIRARESARADRLYEDPWAEEFVAAARDGFEPERWARLLALADQFYPGRTLGVRPVDDRVREAVGAGCRQVVILGAGLGTRAFRLGLAEDVRVVEIDLPELFSFKEPVLDRAGAVPTCVRNVIPMSLAHDWRTVLVETGLRADRPTCWVDEGSLGYLSAEENRRIVRTLTELSAPGSRFGVGRFQVDPAAGPYPELRRFVSGDSAPPRAVGGLGDDAQAWLEEIGWDTEFRGWDEMVAPLGRRCPPQSPGGGHIEAVRR